MNIVLGNNLGTGEQVSLSPLDRGLGTYVIGLTGTGKSTLLLNMMVQDVEAGHGLTVLDPHGDLAVDLLNRVPRERQRDVIYLDFGDKAYPPGLDIFASSGKGDAGVEAREVNAAIDAFRKLLGKESWGPRLENLLRMTALAFRDNPGCTMTEIPTILTSDAFRAYCMDHIRDGAVLGYWEDYDAKKGKDAFIESTMTKVYPFVTNPLLKRIVGQPGKVIDFSDVLAHKKIVIVRIPRGILTAPVTGFLAFLIVDRLLTAAFARAELPTTSRPFHAIYCDEFQMYATPDFEEFIAGGRKYGVGLLIAHQWQEQLDEATRAAGRAGRNTIVFQVSDANAQSFARGFRDVAIPKPPKARPIPAEPWNILESRGHTDPGVNTCIREIKKVITNLTVSFQIEWEVNDYVPNRLKTLKLDPLHHYLNEWLAGRLSGKEDDPQFYLEMVYAWSGEGGKVGGEGQTRAQVRHWLLGKLALEMVLLGEQLRIVGLASPEDDQTTQVEIARDLSSLPSFHAKCKLMRDGRVVECTIKTSPPGGTQSGSIAQGIIRGKQTALLHIGGGSGSQAQGVPGGAGRGGRRGSGAGRSEEPLLRRTTEAVLTRV